MKIVANQNSKVSVFEDGISIKEVITTLMQNNESEVSVWSEQDFVYASDGFGLFYNQWHWKVRHSDWKVI